MGKVFKSFYLKKKTQISFSRNDDSMSHTQLQLPQSTGIHEYLLAA